MAGTVFAPLGVVTAADTLIGSGVRVDSGKIAAIGPASAITQPGDQVIQAPDALLIPGLIDVHVHGGEGRRFGHADSAGLDALMRTFASWGVTGALPTLGAMLPGETAEAVQELRLLAGRQSGGARVLGIHLEGPYFNPKKKGAQNGAAIRLPDRSETEQLLALGGGLVRLMTLAPEMSGADAVLAALAEAGAVASAGHTEIGWEDLLRVVPLGVRHATHTGNAMLGLQQRMPGTLGAVLAIDEINCELIADGVHIHPAIMKLIWRAKGTDRMILVSDATASAGLPDGVYHQGHRSVTIQDGKATLADGTLAGSCSPLHRGVRNMVQLCGAPVHEAVRMASLNPARVIGVDGFTGSIAIGKEADLVLVDSDFRPMLTMVQGQVVYTA